MNLDINSGVTKYGRQFALFYKVFNMNNTFKIIIFCLPFYFLHQSYGSSDEIDVRNLFDIVEWGNTFVFLPRPVQTTKKPAEQKPDEQKPDNPLLKWIKEADFENFEKNKTKDDCFALTNDERSLLGVAAFLGQLRFLESICSYEGINASYHDKQGKKAVDYAREGLQNLIKSQSWPWGNSEEFLVRCKEYEDCISFLGEKEKQDKIKKRSIKNK